MSFPHFALFVFFTSFLLVSCGQDGGLGIEELIGTDTTSENSTGGTPPPPEATPAPAPVGIIFATDATVQGDGTATGDGSGTPGLVNMDNFCSTEATSKGLTGTFKALIYHNTDRVACTSISCATNGVDENNNWVLEPNTEYRREDGVTTIGFTTVSGIFKFPLTNSIDTDTGDVWTGFRNDWRLLPSQACSNWTSDSGQGANGKSNSTSSSFLWDFTTNLCFSNKRVYCAEQVTIPTPPVKSFGVIFKTTEQVNGTGATTGTGLGFTDFDTICNTEARSKSLDGTFKAMIGIGGSKRRACNNANCSGSGKLENSNWVLLPNTEYRTEDKTTVIGTTNSFGIFSFPLTNSIDTSSENIWTGMTPDWRNGNGANGDCSGWTSSSASDDANSGTANETSSSAISATSSGCNLTQSFYCAEQLTAPAPAPQPAYRKIFMTASSYAGGDNLLPANGINDFDNICNAEAALKGFNDDTFKALLVTRSAVNRFVCLSPFCGSGSNATNWVLEANTEYRREDGTTVIGTTDANAIFSFPLTNSFTGTPDTYWFGSVENWASPPANDDCGGWSVTAGGFKGRIGRGDETGGLSINLNGLGPHVSCSTTHKVLCAEQARP